MKYGYFDDEKKEYVITKPDTPAPWANYLGSTDYGAIISNNAGGYSFRKSGANGRILRYYFNNSDQPGRYIYIRDDEQEDYWSASWQPVGKDLSLYKSECRHGIAYTKMEADYSQIHSEVLYYVPLGKEHEVWNVIVRNDSGKTRELTISGFAGFTNEPNYEQDLVNLQYTLFISRTYFRGNRIQQVINENEEGKIERFFGLCGAEVSSYCGDLDEFTGKYRGFGNPAGIESGNLGNKLNYNCNSCGALSAKIVLKPGESKQVAFILGEKPDADADKLIKEYENLEETCKKDIETLRSYWDSKLSHFHVKTPSKEFNTMVNIWNAYNCFMTFLWSRAASFVYCGLRNGYGYRDTVQDIQGIIHLAPEMAKEQIRFMLSAQVDNGAGLPLVKYTHNPGHEDTPDDASYVKETGHPAYRADDALWLFPTVYKYIAESGDTAFIDEEVAFANKGTGTVYEHLKRAISFSLDNMGVHGMPAGLYADWNDCLRLGKYGESTFVAFQFYLAFTILKEIAEEKNDKEYIVFLEEHQSKLGETIQTLCWDEDRFIRGFRENGEVIGKHTDPEANMWLNPQTWSVISGLASDGQADKALGSVYSLLNTKYGAMVMTPPYKDHAFEGALMTCFNSYVKENGGIFSQPQGWLILAEALRGHGNRAFGYFMETAPAAMNDYAEIRRMEPYCHGQFTEASGSPYYGRSHVHWLTGTASTIMVGCVEGILGMRPGLHGLRIEPAIPGEWEEIFIEKDFRGAHLDITIKNPLHLESGVKSLYINGKKMPDNYIPADELSGQNEICYYNS